jgi:hypothetical protein
MNVSRRPAIWRLAAMLVVVLLLAVPGAFAQTTQTQRLRVKIGPANVYERPRTSSDVVMVAQEGTILDVLGREDTWYWVLLPPDGNGQRRGGYIAIYLVDLISPKGPDVLPRTGLPAVAVKPPVPRSVVPAGRPTTRYHVGIGGGGQSAARPFADDVVFQIYDESAQYHAYYSTSRSSALDAMLGLRFGQHFVLAVAFWRSAPVPSADISAVIPHPFSYNTPRPASAGGFAAGRVENDGHLQLTWLVPLSSHVDLSMFGGPSLFYVRQDLVSGLSLRESYPYDTVGISGFQTVRKSKAAIGGNAGVDLTVMVWRYIGVGVSARYARASLTMASGDSGTIKVQAGGAQVSGGLRMRF